MVSRRLISIALVGACILSAAVGTATTLLVAERGPAGPPGAEGPEGPPGEDAYEALSRVEDAEDRSDELESQLSDLELETSSVGSRVSELELDVPVGLSDDVRGIEAATSEICSALDLYCR
jgi:hypothetical protein